MAATRKSAKRTGRRKRSSAKGSSTKKRSRRKSAKGRTKRRASKRATLKRTARKGIRAAKGGIATVRTAGEKTWKALRSTTAQVVEGVKDRLGNETDRNPAY